MISWIPIKSDVTYYHNPLIDEDKTNGTKTITFRLIYLVTNEGQDLMSTL